MNKLEKWERRLEEKRLWENSQLELNRLISLKKKKLRLKDKEQELIRGMKSWVYLKKGQPSKIELAWIIYSQLGWKGYDIEEEELWEDLPETDPLEIMELCQEIDNKKTIGLLNEPESVVPEEILLSLRVVLNTLATEGIDIRKQYFSQNWARKGKKHVGGRIQEIASRSKHQWEFEKENEQREGKLIKRSKDGKSKKKKKGKVRLGKKKPSILSSFFGLI